MSMPGKKNKKTDKPETPNPPQIKEPGSAKEIREKKVKEPEDADKQERRPSK